MLTRMLLAVTMFVSVGSSAAVVRGASSQPAGCDEMRAVTLNGVSQVVRCESEHSTDRAGAQGGSTCHEIRAVTLNGTSQVVRCEPEHGAVDARASARRFSSFGR